MGTVKDERRVIVCLRSQSVPDRSGEEKGEECQWIWCQFAKEGECRIFVTTRECMLAKKGERDISVVVPTPEGYNVELSPISMWPGEEEEKASSSKRLHEYTEDDEENVIALVNRG